MIAVDAKPPTVCDHCGADEMGCAVKAGLSGRPCCADCDHDDDARSGDAVDHHDHDSRFTTQKGTPVDE